MAAHELPDVTIVADAGMISDANMKAIEAAGLSFILGMKVPDVPYVVDAWRREHRARRSPTGASLADAARHRRAGRQGRQGRRRAGPRSSGNRFIQLEGAVDQEVRQAARRYRETEIKAGQHVITAADPLPDDLRQALDAINHAS
jgi:hypothetical protein